MKINIKKIITLTFSLLSLSSFIFTPASQAGINENTEVLAVTDTEFRRYLAENEVSELDIPDYDNVTAIRITEGNNNLVIVKQAHWYGDANASAVNIKGNDNIASSFQIGGDNQSYLYINGNQNIAIISQIGYDNSAYINQEGDGNTAYLYQSGYHSNDIIDQRGNDNRAFIVNKQYSNNLSGSGSLVKQAGDSSVLLINGMSRFNISVKSQ